jgi:hypothetical protein
MTLFPQAAQVQQSNLIECRADASLFAKIRNCDFGGPCARRFAFRASAVRRIVEYFYDQRRSTAWLESRRAPGTATAHGSNEQRSGWPEPIIGQRNCAGRSFIDGGAFRIYQPRRLAQKRSPHFRAGISDHRNHCSVLTPRRRPESFAEEAAGCPADSGVVALAVMATVLD